jgi:mono/diheme cytochrome c family protein
MARQLRLTTLRLLSLTLVTLVLGACDGPPSPATEPPARSALAPGGGADLPASRSLAGQGRSHYEEHCVVCHGPAGGGDGPAAGALRPRPTNFLDAGYMADQRPDWYHRALRRGVPGSAMGGWDHRLDEDSRWDTVFYVWSLAVPAAQLAAGEALYAERCAACHGGGGRGPGAPRLDDPLRARLSRNESAAQLRRVHPGLVAEPPGAAGDLAAWLATFLYEPAATPAPATPTAAGP